MHGNRSLSQLAASMPIVIIIRIFFVSVDTVRKYLPVNTS